MAISLALLAWAVGAGQVTSPHPFGDRSKIRTTILPNTRPGAPRPLPKASLQVTQPVSPYLPGTSQPPLLDKHVHFFENRTTRVRWMGNRWELWSGATWLKDFDRRENDAREALRVIRRLNLNARGTIGSPVPVMEYWLSNGQAPQGLSSGFRLRPLDLESLRVEKIQQNWCVRDDRQCYFNFGSQENDAREAVKMIRLYGFSHIGYVGYPRPSMIYFTGSRTGWNAGMPLRPRHIPVKSIAKRTVAKNGTKDKTSAKFKQLPADKQAQLSQYQAQQLARGYGQLSPPVRGDTTQFRIDPNKIMLRNEGGQWKLFHGNMVLVNYRSDQENAQKALQLVRSYRCNYFCLIGRTASSFHYFLANGHAPRGVSYTVKGRSLNLGRVTVRQTARGWCVCDGETPIFGFGANKANAEQAATAISRYQFDYLITLGTNMPFLVRTR